jgi:hypothetical protein
MNLISTQVIESRLSLNFSSDHELLGSMYEHSMAMRVPWMTLEKPAPYVIPCVVKMRCILFLFALHASARRLMWLNIEGNLLQDNLHKEWLDISLSPPRLSLDYLLGKIDSSWHFNTASVIDRHFHQFLLSAASSQKNRLE